MAFTVIDANTSWQELAIAQEIRVAYNKRRTACGLSLMDDPTEDVTVSSFILSVQTGIEEMATQFANPSATLAGQTSLPANYATVAAFMTAAGLSASGYWRRIADGGTQPETWTSYAASGWSYGKIQNLDLAGPWLFQDLMTALSHMTRNVVPASDAVTEAYGESWWNLPSSDPQTNEATGNVALTIVPWSPPASGPVEAYASKTWSDLAGRDHCSCYIRLWRVRAVYRRPAKVTFVALIDADSTETFFSVTGIANSQIGHTITTPNMDAGGGYATGWLWANPSAVGTPAWSAMSAVIPWSSVSAGSTVTKSFSISPANRVCVLDLTITDGPV